MPRLTLRSNSTLPGGPRRSHSHSHFAGNLPGNVTVPVPGNLTRRTDRRLRGVLGGWRAGVLGGLLATLGSFTANSTVANDWPGFLGPSGNGVVATADVPASFSVATDDAPAENIAWRTPLAGRGVSGPIVVGERVFATGSSGLEQRWLEVTCLDLNDGSVLWTRKQKATGRPYAHPTSANAAPTPCSDGERVFAFFSSNDLVCYDLEGNLQWFRGLAFDHPKAGNDVGMSASPVVVGGVVVVQSEAQAEAFATGIDARTGATLWEIKRPQRANWASPSVARGSDGQAVVLLQSSQDLIAVDPRSGSQVWKLDIGCASIPTVVAIDNTLYVPAGGLKVYDLPDVFDAPTLKWESSRGAPGNSSTLVRGDQIYSVKGSVLAAVDSTGKSLWQLRLGEVGTVWATPVIAGERMFVFSMAGQCVTVDLSGEEGKVIGTSVLGEEVLGSPAIAGDALLVRSVQAVWKISSK
jgi:outer membrane protein assembly factor BamB